LERKHEQRARRRASNGRQWCVFFENKVGNETGKVATNYKEERG
jgi:hypothetical protein